MLSSSSPPFFWRRRETAVWARTTARQLDAGSVQPARLLRPPAAARLSPPDATPAVADRDPQIACVSSCTVHPGLRLAQAFPKRSSESRSYPCLCIRALDPVCGLQCLGHACLCLLASEHHSYYLVKSLLSHFCSNQAQLELFGPPSWRQTSLWLQRLPARVCLISSGGVACEVPPLAWPVGPGVVARRFRAGAALKSLRGLFFLLVTRLYDSVLALCQSLCQCECYCWGPYIYFTHKNVEC